MNSLLQTIKLHKWKKELRVILLETNLKWQLKLFLQEKDLNLSTIVFEIKTKRNTEKSCYLRMFHLQQFTITKAIQNFYSFQRDSICKFVLSASGNKLKVLLMRNYLTCI